MRSEKIYYFGSFDIAGSKYKRRYNLSATTKMDYIISALNQGGYDVEIISASYIIDKKWCFDKGGKKKINEATLLNLSPSFGAKTSIGKLAGIIFTACWFFLKLLKIKRGQTLIVYHGDWYSKPIMLAKKIKGFQLIVEIEEIYTFAFNRKQSNLKKELNFFNSADKLILVNDLLAGYLNFPKEKSLVSYGSYSVDNQSSKINSFNDDKIHLVYAGSFSKRKFGAQSAVAAAEFLPEKYVMHIVGFGDKETTEELLAQIDSVNRTSKCKIIYEGEKRGVDYDHFMKGCHIGLCTQKMDCDYTLYAFPSKVLSYMSLGLNVVTAPLVALPASSISQYLTYYPEDTSESLAEAVINAKIYSRDELKEVVIKLNNKFINDLNQLIQANY